MAQFSTAPAGLQLLKRTVYNASNTHNFDPRSKWANVRLVGGGANGGAVTASAGYVGGGGGAGGYSEGLIPVSVFGTSQVVTIGAAGGTTSFGALLQATGGAVGAAGAATSVLGGLGGIGSGGDINLRGGSGDCALYNTTLSIGFSGRGGDSMFGGGALGRINTGVQAGNAAPANSGAGGSGATAGAGGSASGGAGGTGKCIVDEYA